MITIVGDMFFADMSEEEIEDISTTFGRNTTIFAYNSRVPEGYLKKFKNSIFLKGKYDPGKEPYITAPTIKYIEGKKFLLVPYTKNLPKYLFEDIKYNTYFGIIIGGKVPFEIQKAIAYVTGAHIIISRPENDTFIHFETSHSDNTLFIGVKSRNGYVIDVDLNSIQFCLRKIKTPQRRLLL